jgi:molybdenum cofactor biosynthesis protein B
MPIDESRPFLPVRIAVLTVSDSRTSADDRSGDTLVERLEAAGHILAARAIVKDDFELIVSRLHAWIDDPQVDCVITTGGTGVTGRDVTPEALARVWDKEIPGFGELFRWLSYQSIGTSTVQSRATPAVVRASRLHRGREGRLGRHPCHPARQPPPPLQFRRADASADGTLSVFVLDMFLEVPIVAPCPAPPAPRAARPRTPSATAST